MLGSVAALLGLLCLSGRGAWATSSGIDGLHVCNVLTEELGCHPDQFTNGDHLKCAEKSAPFTKYMHWTTRAVRDGRWSITAGPESAPARTSYKPGELIEIHVRMLNYWNAHTYRGIMMHFQQSSDANAAGAFAKQDRTNANGLWNPTVGEWHVVPQNPRMFHNTLNTGCGKGVLLHATATYKNSHEVFWFKAPAQGTGTIALRALVKQGDANMGEFYFPMQNGDLILTEDTNALPAPSGAWVRGNPGESCTEACARLSTKGCDAASLQTGLVTPAMMQSQIIDERVAQCDVPLLSNCDQLGPTTSETDYCYVYDSSLCTGRNQQTPTCAARSTDPLDSRRLCPCGAAPTCTPLTTCPDVNQYCGNYPDGCGGIISCGGCPQAHQNCTAHPTTAGVSQCTCQSHTCAEHGWECGSHDDGCGTPLLCGNSGACASAGENCTQGSQCVPNGCSPQDSCASLSFQCGTATTPCQAGTSTPATQLQCGSCRNGESCVNNQCVCSTNPTCSSLGLECGAVQPTCGPLLDCGQCPSGQTCSATTNMCIDRCGSCAPKSSCEFVTGACICDYGEDDVTGKCRDSEKSVDPGVSSSSTRAPSALLALALAFAVSGGRATSRFAMVAAVAVLALVAATPAQAHNWIGTMSRARFASTAAPFPPRMGKMPHVQVGPNDDFQIEYVQGHTRFSYFVVHHADDAGKVKDVTSQDLDTYLDEYMGDAGVSAHARAMTAEWRRYHRRCGTPISAQDLYNDVSNSNGKTWTPNYFVGRVTGGPGYLGQRPQAFWDHSANCRKYENEDPNNRGTMLNRTTDNNAYQYNYQDAQLIDDKRARYTNSKWPWILEVVKTNHVIDQPSRPDVLRFALDGALAKGHYMVSWRWRGYYDAIDVDYQTANVPVADRYGAYDPTPPFRRVDHAIFRRYTRVRRGYGWGECLEIATTAQACMNRCTGSCPGIAVMPVKLPSTVRASFRSARSNAGGYNTLIPWGNATDWCNPAEWPSNVNQLRDPDNAYMCFRADVGSGNGTQGEFITTRDPEDPVFYSSVILRTPSRNFTLEPTSPFNVDETEDKTWSYSDTCVSCDEMERNKETNRVPSWKPKRTGCVNCDREASTATPTDFTPSSTSADSRFIGYSVNPDVSTPSCVKPLGGLLHGVKRMFQSECEELASQDTECQEVLFDRRYIAYGENYGDDRVGDAQCSCWRKSCGVLKTMEDPSTTTPAVTNENWYVFQNKNAAPETPAGATCPSGTQDSSNAYCCPAACGVCSRYDNSANPSPVAYCSRVNYLNPGRTCDKYAAPCRIV